MSTPRVLLVGPSFSGGGAEGRFTNIAIHIFGGKIDVAVLVDDDSCEQHIAGEIFDLGWNGRLSYPKLVWRLVKRLQSQKYDVLMAFGLFPNVVTLVASMIVGGDIKLIISEITRPEMEARSMRGRVYNFMRRTLYAHSTLITANSIDGLKEACKLAGVPVTQGVRVVNVIDRSHLAKKTVVAPNMPLTNEKFVVCVARLDLMKRIDTVVDAFGILAGQIDCDLVIIGDGEARPALEAQVNGLGLQDSVMFTGRLDNPFPLLSSSAAFVLASEYEGFSNSVLEAMFFDVPVITSICSSDARDMCDQGAALGFEVGDYQQLARHIAKVVSDEDQRQDLVRRAHEYRAPHAIENAIPFYEDLIRKVSNDSSDLQSFSPKL